jgi:ATP-dependent Zn protease
LLAGSAQGLNDLLNARVQRASAYHESGHVTVAVLQEIPVTRVTLVPSPLDGYRACCFIQARSESADVARTVAESYALVTLAGPIAEGRAGHMPHAQSIKAHHAEASEELLLTGPLNGEPELQAHLDYLRERAIGLVHRHWPGVCALADALLTARTIDGPEAELIVIRALFAADLLPEYLAWRLDA